MQSLAGGALLHWLPPRCAWPTLTPFAAHAADKGKPGKAATPAAAPSAPAACTLTHPDQPKNEWRCAPSPTSSCCRRPQSEATKAVLTVKSQAAVQDAKVTLSVNENFEVLSTDGFSNARAQASGVGPVSTISRSTDLAAGGTKTYEFTLRATGKGTASPRPG